VLQKISPLPSPRKAGLRAGRLPLSFDKLRMASESNHLPDPAKDGTFCKGRERGKENNSKQDLLSLRRER